MKLILTTAVSAFLISAPLSYALAQAPENSPSTTMDNGAGHNGSMAPSKPGSVNEKVSTGRSVHKTTKRTHKTKKPM